jgi:hypothetical protein
LTADTGIAIIISEVEFAPKHTFCRFARHFMNLTRIKLVIFCLTILIGLGTITRSAGAQSGSHLDLDFHRVPWTQLSFHAKNFWVEVSTDIQMKSLRASDLDAVLLASPKGIPIKPQTSQINEMTINTVIDPRFRSPVKIHNRIWFDPTDASALGRIRLRRGDDDFKKMYRFTEQGVFRHRIEPKDRGEARLEPDKWTDIKDTFYPFDINQLKCPIISERSVPIYIISAAALSKTNKPLTICIFGKRQLHRVKIQKEGTHPIKIKYIEKKQQVETHKEDTVMAHKMVITAQPIESHLEDAENFSFLGLHEDITIYIDSATGLPIQISGIIPSIGKAELKLNFVQLNQASD